MGKTSGRKSEWIEPVSDSGGLLYKPLIHILLIAAVGLLAYSNTFNGPFQWDEVEYIIGNPIVEDISYYLSPSKALGTPYYPLLKSRPVGYFTFALNYRFHGLNVTGYHIVNLSIHIINAILVYFMIFLTFQTPYLRIQNSEFTPYSHIIPLAVALLFVAHPVQTEAVTYVFQRLASLVSMFYLLSLVLYIKGRLTVQKSVVSSQKSEGTQDSKLKIQSSVIWYLLSLVSAVLAMKTKENAFTLPLVIMLYEFLFFSGPVKIRLFRLAPFLLTLPIIPLTLIGMDKPAGEIISLMADPAALGTQEISRNEYLFTQFRVIVTYIRLLFLPVNQNLAYDYPVYRSFFVPQVLLSFLLLMSILGLAVYIIIKVKKSDESMQYAVSSKQPVAYSLLLTPYSRLIAFGIFWFFMTISVESSIIPVSMLIDEYRVYLPSAGAFTSIVTGVFMFAMRGGSANAGRNEKLAISMLLLAVIVLSAATYMRNTLWMDNVSLWRDVVKKSPNLYRGYTNLGKAYYEKGDYKKAFEMFERVVALRPSHFEAYNNRGNAYNSLGRLEEAVADYDKAIALNPSNFVAYNNRGNIFNSTGQFDKAVADYDKAIALNPSDSALYANRGNIFNRTGQFDKAIEDYSKAAALNPSDHKAYAVLGVLFGRTGAFDKAVESFNKAVAINPNVDSVYNDRGFTYFLMKQYDRALADFDKTIELNRNYAQAYGNRGNLYLETGDREHAALDLQKACNLGAQAACSALQNLQ